MEQHMSTFEQKVKAIIAEQLSVSADKITPQARFVEDLGADSLDTVELVMALEEAFEVDIPDDAAEKIATFQDVLDYLKAHARKAA
jgi:acyl carrier protein